MRANVSETYKTHHVKKDLMGIVKSIDPGQPVQFDYCRNFSLLADFLCINPFQNDKFQTLPNSNSLQTAILNLMKMAQSSLKG